MFLSQLVVFREQRNNTCEESSKMTGKKLSIWEQQHKTSVTHSCIRELEWTKCHFQGTLQKCLRTYQIPLRKSIQGAYQSQTVYPLLNTEFPDFHNQFLKTKLCSFLPNIVGNRQGRRNGGALRGHCLPAPWKGATGAQVPLHTSIISNFMIYQDQFETNLLQLFAHT